MYTADALPRDSHKLDATGKKICAKCRKRKPSTAFNKDSARPSGLHRFCRTCHRSVQSTKRSRNREVALAYGKQWRDKLRAEILAAYGGKCACCNESAQEFLGIDHIFGDGKDDLRPGGKKRVGGLELYGRLRREGFPKDRYRLLCHNCNLARGIYGYCPHERKSQ